MMNDHRIHQGYCLKKKEQKEEKCLATVGLVRMRAETETMREDIRGFSLASLAEITAEGRFLKAGFSAIHNGRICFTLTFAFISFTTPATHFDPRR